MNNKITSVQQLVMALDMCTGDYCVIDIMENADIPESEFEKYYYWNDEHYSRVSIAKTDKYEVLLVCWEKDQASKIHDFNSHEAWIHPICGQLKEEKFIMSKQGDGLIKVSSLHLSKGDFSYMRDVGIHRYSNVYGARSSSLVIFSPPLKKLRTYDESTGRAEWVDTWYDKEFNLIEENAGLSH